MSKRLLTVSLAIAVASALIFIPLTAGGQEGRSKDARAGTPVPSDPGATTVEEGTWDGDGPAPRDQVIPDDLIVQFSECVGNDCVNGESFGFDTQRYKENNLRVHFDDTSTSASFPRNDWRITVNDSSNGGAEHFSIDDVTGSRTPFRILAGAPSNSLHVDANGDIGLGVANAVVELHIKDGDTPTVRLEQDGSSGFTPQTWDLAGNETNFFIRDVTNGSKLPFRIRPGAPTSSIDVAASGAIGLGTSSPTAELDIRDNVAGTAGTFIHFNDDTAPGNAGSTTGSSDWFIGIENAAGTGQKRFRITDSLSSATTNFDIRTGGQVELNGILIHSSDRNMKENIEAVDTATILDQVAGLDIATWSYIHDPDSATHLGPMAQDFAAAFGLGNTDTGIATLDADGVALAAIQALYNRVVELEAQLAEAAD